MTDFCVISLMLYPRCLSHSSCL